MNRRALERRLDTLSRSELRALATQLTDWVGDDAAAHLLDTSPFERAGGARQLALGAVDADALSAELAHLRAVAIASYRAHAVGLEFPSSLTAQLGALLTAAADRAAEGVRFDFRVGVELADEVYGTLGRVDRARRSFAPEAGLPDVNLAQLDEALRAGAGHAALDETTFGRVVDVAATASRSGAGGGGWRWVGAALARTQPDTRGWLARRLEHGARDPDALALLTALARETARPAATSGELDRLVQLCELYSDQGAAIVALLVESLTLAERVHEARFWVGEGRMRYPSSTEWARLEESLL
ncbi:MAG: hypothetical protein H6700_00685 [Myxococcales bacterium]|nr:hypothetical protein [Myxococcales bacterium]